MATKMIRHQSTGKKEADPEELLRLKFRAKCQFRAIVRLALANSYWLLEESEQYEGLDDVKRRVAQAMRGKTKKKRLLSLTDKALLNKPAKERSDQEKLYIYRIIGGLKCFKRYPNHVKKKLAAATYFKYYGPGRVIVRQHQEAHAMYFIVSGDVVVSQMIFDGLLNKNVPVEIGTMHAGDMFGEVSLLHGIPRTATCTTTSHCEMLILQKDDFKSILQTTIQASWDEVRCAMSYFTYFDALDEVARREGCIMAKMKSYAINEIILGDGVGVPNFVYFVLSGSCDMIESLQVIRNTHLGRAYYKLYDPYVHFKSIFNKIQVTEEEIEQDFDEKYFTAYKNLSRNSKLRVESSSTSSTFKVLDSIFKIGTATESKSALQEKTRSLSMTQEEDRESKRPSHASRRVTEEKQTRPSSSSQHKHVTAAEIKDVDDDKRLPSRRSGSTRTQELLPVTDGHRESVRFSVLPAQVQLLPPPENVRTYFMQVCRFNPGSTFGFGENMRDRRIVSRSAVDCMLMPKIWLQQRNTANIWSRIQHFLERKIPTKKELFENFVTERRWEEFRNQLVNDVVSRSNTVNWTSMHDVPYSIRMEELLDI